MTELARLDCYNWAQYELDMAVNAADSPVKKYANTAAKYAARLRKAGGPTPSITPWPGIITPRSASWEEAFAATREGILQSASGPGPGRSCSIIMNSSSPEKGRRMRSGLRSRA